MTFGLIKHPLIYLCNFRPYIFIIQYSLSLWSSKIIRITFCGLGPHGTWTICRFSGGFAPPLKFSPLEFSIIMIKMITFLQHSNNLEHNNNLDVIKGPAKLNWIYSPSRVFAPPREFFSIRPFHRPWVIQQKTTKLM